MNRKSVLGGADKALPWLALAGVAAAAGVAGLLAGGALRARRPELEDLPQRVGRGEIGRGDRGRGADDPTEIPGRGWKDILWRTAAEMQADDIAGVARGVAYSGLLALFPALAAFVSIYGLFADVNTAREQLAGLTGLVPAEALTLLGNEMVRIAKANDAGLSVTAVVGLVVSIWSTNAGMTTLFKGLNVAFEETEKRSLIRRMLMTLLFTIGMLVFFVLSAGAVVAAPAVLEVFHAGRLGPWLAWLRWPGLLAVTTFGLSLLYRYGPSREHARWRWVSLGAVAAAVMWLAASLVFSWYLSNFAHYQATYGSLGAVFGFMVWLWLSALVVLGGAELNAEIEHQTARDSTTGAPEPMGERGAAMADEVGRPAPAKLFTGSLAYLLRKKPDPRKAREQMETEAAA